MSSDAVENSVLLAAYRTSAYVARLTQGRCVCLRVDAELPRELGEMMQPGEVAGFITAWNPQSQPASPQTNRKRQRELLAALRPASRKIFVGVGRGEHWRESSLCVLGVPLATLDALAQRFGQNAIVVASPGEPVRLRICRGSAKPSAIDPDRDPSPP